MKANDFVINDTTNTSMTCPNERRFTVIGMVGIEYTTCPSKNQNANNWHTQLLRE
jgi:hypothetical protein